MVRTRQKSMDNTNEGPTRVQQQSVDHFKLDIEMMDHDELHKFSKWDYKDKLAAKIREMYPALDAKVIDDLSHYGANALNNTANGSCLKLDREYKDTVSLRGPKSGANRLAQWITPTMNRITAPLDRLQRSLRSRLSPKLRDSLTYDSLAEIGRAHV
jgi:hypothetical protein